MDGGNACCHQNQSVKRKKELNQVQSCALTPGQSRQAACRGIQQENETQLNNWSLLGWDLTRNRAENIRHTHTDTHPSTHIWTLAENSPRVRLASKLQAETRSLWVLSLFSQMIIRTQLYFMPLASCSSPDYSYCLTQNYGVCCWQAVWELCIIILLRFKDKNPLKWINGRGVDVT